MGLKEQIFAADDLPREEVSQLVPEWKLSEPLFVRTLHGFERDQFEADNLDQDAPQGQARVNLRNMRARFLVKCLVDKDGVRVFSDVEALELGQRSARVLDRLFEVAQRLNGIREKDLEVIRKNSGPAPSDDSG